MTAHATTTLDKVIADLSLLPGASPTVDHAILHVVFAGLEAAATNDALAPCAFSRRCQNNAPADDGRNSCRVPDYTGSIDTALTLVPHGWRTLCVNENGNGEVRWSWQLTNGHCTVTALAPTAPIAVCIAAMDARRHR
jgi:hypothetical protein